MASMVRQKLPSWEVGGLIWPVNSPISSKLQIKRRHPKVPLFF